jgi:hypothetical protein
MVRISRKGLGQKNNGAAASLRSKVLDEKSLHGAMALGAIGLLFVLYSFSISSSDPGLNQVLSLRNELLKHRPDLHVQDEKNAEVYNAIAMDIMHVLDCHQLLNTTINSNNDRRFRRRLDEGGEGGSGEGDSGGEGGDERDKEEERRFGLGDDDMGGGGFGGIYKDATAAHLFCLAAYAKENDKETGQWKDEIKCDATGAKQVALLDLWSTARGEFARELALLKDVLQSSRETMREISATTLHLWAPSADVGMDYMIGHVNNQEKTVDHGGLYGLHQNLGPGKIFVDVGSCLGTTSFAMALLYPGTQIVSIEAASPNWLLQEINWRCNAAFDKVHPTVILSGVGPSHLSNSFAKFLWKKDHTTVTRSWTPKAERSANDVEIMVKLQPWPNLLALARLDSQQQQKSGIDVLNVDCGACEYNLIPSMTDAEFDAIHTVMGGVHWGYIPIAKLPSSKRAKETHERLCRHENFARTAKECCQFPNLQVQSSYPGQALEREKSVGFPPKAGTVRDVAGELCDDYDAWAIEKHVNDINNDFGWFQITSSAD